MNDTCSKLMDQKKKSTSMNARSYGIYYMKGQNKHSFISVEKHMFDQWMNRNYVG